MPDIRQILRSQARERGVRLDILEKDYALSYLLVAVSETPPLSPLGLKGGTALRKAYCMVRVQFPGQRQSLCRLKVEITVDEPVLLPVERRPLRHGFDEELPATLRVYALAEIVAEKLRALLQSARHLRKRGWGASRVCRDYYDLWSVLRRGDWQGGSIPDLVRRKSDLRGVRFFSPQDFLAEELLNVARREWQAQLLPFRLQPVTVERV